MFLSLSFLLLEGDMRKGDIHKESETLWEKLSPPFRTLLVHIF
jgi:hypothetical protein